MRDPNFLDELILEAEEKESKLSLAHHDLIIVEVAKLYNKIDEVFKEAESEIEIINQWALTKNAKLQDKIEYLSKKLEACIR